MNYIAICENNNRSVTNALSGKNPDNVYIVVNASSINPKILNTRIKHIKSTTDVAEYVEVLQRKLGNVTILDEQNIIKVDPEFIATAV